MKQNMIRLSQRYVAALQKHLKQGRGADSQPALRIGREAVALGLETLELARIHEQALLALGLSKAKKALTRPAAIFFAKANTLIEETHRTARQTKVHLSRLMTTLARRTAQLAASNHQLQQGVARRKIMETDFAERGRSHQKRLEESLELQKCLRQLTHRVIAAQEDERKKISLELQDEIAQTLLGINVRLLALKHESHSNSKGLKHEIASTQRLVIKSARSMRQVGRKIGGL